MPAASVLISIPFGLAFVLWPADAFWKIGSLNVPHAIVFAAGFSFFNSWWPTLSFAAVNHLVNSSQRATSLAVLSLFLTLFGAGFGPLLTGTFSDVFASGNDGAGLKYALALMLSMLVISAWFYFKAISPYQQHMNETQLTDQTANNDINKTPTIGNESPATQ